MLSNSWEFQLYSNNRSNSYTRDGYGWACQVLSGV